MQLCEIIVYEEIPFYWKTYSTVVCNYKMVIVHVFGMHLSAVNK